ncbi:sulfite exporter TauE/SafE family protein [Candidatus Bathyarchaeota archaeon]|nr:MAG: sulfite exporter TauE/SafE family protein [Candidatus Bathyarchaeota archaeon]
MCQTKLLWLSSIYPIIVIIPIKNASKESITRIRINFLLRYVEIKMLMFPSLTFSAHKPHSLQKCLSKEEHFYSSYMPTIFMLNEIFVLLIILAAGSLGSMLGVGGGFIIVPMLVLLLNFPMHEAVSISLASISGIALSSFLMYAWNRRVDYKLGISLELFTFLGALIGSTIATMLSCSFLEVLFGFVLIYVSLIMYKKPIGQKESYFGLKIFKTKTAAFLFSYTSSFLAGLLASMTGIGGGVLKVPIMTLILGVPIKTAIGTSEFMIIITSLTAAINYQIQGIGTVSYKIFGVAGGFIGGQIGSRIGLRTRSSLLKIFFAVLLFCFSVLMVIKGMIGFPL